MSAFDSAESATRSPLRSGFPAELAAALADFASQVHFDRRQGLAIRAGDAELRFGRGKSALDALSDAFYARYFCRLGSELKPTSRYADRTSGEPSFVAALALAARGAFYWEGGWSVTKAEAEWAFVRDNRLTLFVDDRGWLHPREAKVGDPVRLKVPCARENLAQGAFTLVSRAGPPRKDARAAVYLNLSPHGAPGLVEALVLRQGVEKLAFEARLLNDPMMYGRADSAVLAAEPRALPALRELVVALARENPSWLREATPLFAQRVAPGIAVAESESYGRVRCRAVAEAIWPALLAGLPVEKWRVRLPSASGRGAG